MMNKKRTREIGRTKYIMFLPLAALLMIISNIEAVARTTREVAKEVITVVEENLTPKVTAPDMEAATAGMSLTADTEALPETSETPSVATEIQSETPAPQQDKEKLVTYQGVVVDKDGNPVEGAEVIVNARHKLPQNQSFRTDKNGEFSILAFENAPFITIRWEKDSKYMLGGDKIEHEKRTGIKIVMNGQWQNPPANDPDNPVFEVVEQMPVFPDGGMAGLMQFLGKNIRYPVNAQKNGTQGRVTVQFIVNTDGSISNVGVLRGVDPDLDGEAVRVISTMPNWQPGMQKGKAVRVKYTVPVMFRLNDEKKEEYKPVQTIAGSVVVTNQTNGKEPAVSNNVITVFEAVEQMPSFPGGTEGLMRYLAQHIKYPVEAQQARKQGRVIVQVVIDENGNVISPKITRSADPLLDAEAIRVTVNMPKWKPGMQKGKAVNVRYTFPIDFKLQ